MGNTSSQSEAPTTTSQSQDEWKPIRLCGTLPAEVVPAERYCPKSMASAGYDAITHWAEQTEGLKPGLTL